jgi:hypothetical protein
VVSGASLLEGMGFEPPVWDSNRRSAFKEERRENSKAHRQLESPPLQQRVTANRRPDPPMTIDRERSHRLYSNEALRTRPFDELLSKLEYLLEFLTDTSTSSSQ